MSIDLASDIISKGITLILIICLVIILPSLLVGLLVSVFQAATQINEQTLSFLPRLVTILLVLIFAGKWILLRLSDFFYFMFEQAHLLIR